MQSKKSYQRQKENLNTNKNETILQKDVAVLSMYQQESFRILERRTDK